MMEHELNVTYITLGGHVELHKYRYLYFVIMFTVYVLIICSNLTIVCLIWIHENLHQPMYVFIAALLINSVLFSTAIYPKLLMDYLSDKQVITYPVCLFQFLLFYSLCGSEFLVLSAMAYDRFVSICKPLHYHTVMRKTNISTFLLLAWLVPVSLAVGLVTLCAKQNLCSFTLKGIFCNNSIYKLHCVRSRPLTIYGYVILINFLLAPVLFILFTYTKILVISYRSGKEVRKKAAETCLPHLMVLISFSSLCAYDIIIVRLESDIPKTARLIMTLQGVLYHPLFNPLIYGLKMKEINFHLRKVFCQL